MGINSMNLIYHLISKLKNNYTRSAEASCAQSPSRYWHTGSIFNNLVDVVAAAKSVSATAKAC
jgi:hypothetical protein